jgi:7-keto-8-aminopelargonate synthetase-like enzyme
MDGDIGDLPKARKFCDKYNMTLVVDEAHGLGTLGKTGRGVEEYFNMPGSVDVIVGTFSKSLASVGGFIASNSETI